MNENLPLPIEITPKTNLKKLGVEAVTQWFEAYRATSHKIDDPNYSLHQTVAAWLSFQSIPPDKRPFNLPNTPKKLDEFNW